MSRVFANCLNVRDGSSTNIEKVGHYDAVDIINSGNELIENEGRIWLKYLGGSGNYRYVCAINNDNSKYVEVPGHIP